MRKTTPLFRGYVVYDGDARVILGADEYDAALSVFTPSKSLVYVKTELSAERGLRIVKGYLDNEDVRRWAVTDSGVYDEAGRLTGYDPALFDRRFRHASVTGSGEQLRVGGLVEVGDGRRYKGERYQWASSDERYVLDGVFATQYRMRFGLFAGAHYVWCVVDAWYDEVHVGDGCVVFTGAHRIHGIRGCDFGLYDAGPLPDCFDDVAWRNAFTGTVWGEGVVGEYEACGVGVANLVRPAAIEAGRLIAGTVEDEGGVRHALSCYAVVGDDVVTKGGKRFRGMARYVDPVRRRYHDWGGKAWRYGTHVWGAFRYERHIAGETWKAKAVAGHAHFDYANPARIEGDVRTISVAGYDYDRIYGDGGARTIVAGPRSVGVISHPKRIKVAPFDPES